MYRINEVSANEYEVILGDANGDEHENDELIGTYETEEMAIGVIAELGA